MKDVDNCHLKGSKSVRQCTWPDTVDNLGPGLDTWEDSCWQWQTHDTRKQVATALPCQWVNDPSYTSTPPHVVPTQKCLSSAWPWGQLSGQSLTGTQTAARWVQPSSRSQHSIASTLKRGRNG